MANANLDYSFTIFDQNTLPLANPSWLIEDPLMTTMTTKQAVQISPSETRSSGGIPGQGQYQSNTASMVPAPQSNDAAQVFQTRQWIQDQAAHMWPSNLQRLFGHDETLAQNNGLGG